MTVQGQAAYIATVYLFAGFFLIIPTMVATVLAANSFGGGKEPNTLEGSSLHPRQRHRTRVLGKMIGAVLPAVVVSWVCFVRLRSSRQHPRQPPDRAPVLPHTQLVGAHAGGRPRCVRVRHDVRRLGSCGPGQLLTSQPTRSRDSPCCRSSCSWSPGHRGHALGLLFGVLGLVLVILDILMMRWIIVTFDRERVVASFL